MIVACTNCGSRYSVNDARVSNKKFGFDCPKCGISNVIDNTAAGRGMLSGGFSDKEFRKEPAKTAVKTLERPAPDVPDDISISDQIDMALSEEEAGADMDLGPETEGGAVIEEVAEFSENDSDSVPEELTMPEWDKLEGISGKLPSEEKAEEEILEIGIPGEPGEDEGEMTIEELAGNVAEMRIDESEPDEEGIDEDALALDGIRLDDESLLTEEEDTEEGAEAEETGEDLAALTEAGGTRGTRGMEKASADFMPVEEDIDLDSFKDFSTPPAKKPQGKVLETAEFEEIQGDQVVSRDAEDIDEDVTIDLDSLDIQLEEDGEAAGRETAVEELSGSIGAPKKGGVAIVDDKGEDEELTIDANALDISLDEEAEAGPAEIQDEDVTLDVDSLDISLDEGETQPVFDSGDEEDVTLDVDALDISLDEGETQPVFESGDEEDLTLDVDSLDISLDEGETQPVFESGDEEDLTLDVDSLDISLDEGEAQPVFESGDEEDVTLDVDTLDISLDETGETQKGEPEEDGRLSLADAGMSPDDLVQDEISTILEDIDGEESRLSLEDAGLSVDEFETVPETGGEEAELTPMNIDDITDVVHEEKEELLDLPEINLDEFEEMSSKETRRDIDLLDTGGTKEKYLYDTVPGGTINLNIDYTMKNSRLGAVSRLFGIYIIALLPHFVVSLVYSILSLLVGFLNWIVIAFTGRCVDDYLEIQEKAVRYELALAACLIDIVEEMPVFSGSTNIDYALQFEVTYPVRFSRLLALLRLSVIGILIAALPHIVILFVLTVGSILISLAGLISIMVDRKWPHLLFDFMQSYFRYAAGVVAFITGLVDRYPSFRIE